MTELKTLKDIEYDKNRLFTDAVKKEAIEWVKEDIKEIETRQNIEDNDLCLSMIGHLQLQRDRWKRFFNITEEDLKEKT